MEIEESLNVGAFTGLGNSVVAQSQPLYLGFKRMTDFVLGVDWADCFVTGVPDCGAADQMG